MYIKTGDATCPCVGYHSNDQEACFALAGDPPAELGDTVQLCQDDGFVLAEHLVADFARQEISGSFLHLTNLLETVEPVPTEEIPAEPDIRQIRADVDYLAALQGVTL